MKKKMIKLIAIDPNELYENKHKPGPTTVKQQNRGQMNEQNEINSNEKEEEEIEI